MSSITWSDGLAVGHHIIDEQHKTLVELLSKLADGVDRGEDQKKLLKSFLEVYRYSAYHFEDEEELMSSLPFETWHVHRYEHQQFLATLESLAEDFRTKKATVGIETLEYLVNWHLEHTKKSDRSLVEALIAKAG